MSEQHAESVAELAVAEALARTFHETYEALAPHFGYETRPESAMEWADVPEPNRRLMIAVADSIFDRLATGFDLRVNGPRRAPSPFVRKYWVEMFTAVLNDGDETP